jgi:hypothetical protein
VAGTVMPGLKRGTPGFGRCAGGGGGRICAGALVLRVGRRVDRGGGPRPGPWFPEAGRGRRNSALGNQGEKYPAKT